MNLLFRFDFKQVSAFICTASLVQCVCAFMFGTESRPQSMQICLPPKQNPSLHSGPRWNLFLEVISKGFLRGRIIFWSSLKRMHFPRHLFCKYLDKKKIFGSYFSNPMFWWSTTKTSTKTMTRVTLNTKTKTMTKTVSAPVWWSDDQRKRERDQ